MKIKAGRKINGGKARGLKTAPPGFHRTKKDRRDAAISRAESIALHTLPLGQRATYVRQFCPREP